MVLVVEYKRLSFVKNHLFYLLSSSQKGIVAIHRAALGGHVDAIKYLVGLGADVNVKSHVRKKGDVHTLLNLLFLKHFLSCVHEGRQNPL
jgi:ankyrin repeat protein